MAHLLIEGGGTLIGEAFEKKVVDEVYFFIAPKIIGGKEAPTAVEGEGISQMTEALTLKKVEWRQVGRDLLIHGYIK